MNQWSCSDSFLIPWAVPYQAPSSMEFSRQEYWGGFPFRSPGNLPDPGIKPKSSTLQADALPSELPGKPHLGKRLSFLQWLFLTPLSNVSSRYINSLISGVLILFCWSVCFECQCHTVLVTIVLYYSLKLGHVSFQLCSSFSIMPQLFRVFYGAMFILGLIFLFLWNMPL